VIVGGRRPARIGTAAALEPADGADGHVVVADDLAREPGAGHAARRQHVLLGDRHPIRLPLDELDAAGRAPGVAAAGVQDVHAGVLLDGEHEPLAGVHVHRSVTFDRQPGHAQVSPLFSSHHHRIEAAAPGSVQHEGSEGSRRRFNTKVQGEGSLQGAAALVASTR
jgi:hypothetical protein